MPTDTGRRMLFFFMGRLEAPKDLSVTYWRTSAIFCAAFSSGLNSTVPSAVSSTNAAMDSRGCSLNDDVLRLAPILCSHWLGKKGNTSNNGRKVCFVTTLPSPFKPESDVSALLCRSETVHTNSPTGLFFFLICLLTSNRKGDWSIGGTMLSSNQGIGKTLVLSAFLYFLIECVEFLIQRSSLSVTFAVATLFQTVSSSCKRNSFCHLSLVELENFNCVSLATLKVIGIVSGNLHSELKVAEQVTR